MRTRTAVLALVAAVLLCPSSSAQQPEPFKLLFNGKSLDGWEVPTTHADRFVAVDGVLRIKGESRWLLTRDAHDDFVLTFEARPVGPDSVGGILVRTLVLPEHRLAYEVQVANGRQSSPVLLQHHDQKVGPALERPPALVSADGEWHRYRVECVENRIGVWRDDAEVTHAGGLVLTTGAVGVHAAHGVVEFRNVLLKPLDPPRLTLAEGTARAGDSGVTPPSRRSPKSAPAAVPSLAWALGLVGEVVLECVVAANGQVDQCVVTRRFFGPLDEAVLQAALRWTFEEPGTRDGKPVPFVMTLHVNLQPGYVK